MKLTILRDDERVVPREPTVAMAEAWAALAVKRLQSRVKDGSTAKGVVEGAMESYRAVVAAAPPPRTVEITEEEIARSICQSGYEITAPDNMPYWVNFLMEARAVLALIEGKVRS